MGEGVTMSEQPVEETDMSKQERDEIRGRLMDACDTDASLAAHITRQRLERASRHPLPPGFERLGI